MKAKTVFKSIGYSLAGLLILVVLLASGYIVSLTAAYQRVPDQFTLKVENKLGTVNKLSTGTNYTVSTFNVGFGAYNHDFSFFMDGGEYARAQSKAIVNTNTAGALNIVQGLSVDFAMFQEVDIKATRSLGVNQYSAFKAGLIGYESHFAVNFNMPYLIYPFNEPIGAVYGGIATMSKYTIEKAVRYSLPVDFSWPNRFFDLDRCFTASFVPVTNNKYLVLVNLHLSAFDEGGKVRAAQLEKLMTLIEAEYELGNYVVVGGDWNHILGGALYEQETPEQMRPDWVQELPVEFASINFDWAVANDVMTCRTTDIAYTAGVNYEVVIDGFFVSKNVSFSMVQNIDAGFVYSDHNPVKLTFSLNP